MLQLYFMIPFLLSHLQEDPLLEILFHLTFQMPVFRIPGRQSGMELPIQQVALLPSHKSGIGTGLPLSISMDVGAFESIKGGKTTATYPSL